MDFDKINHLSSHFSNLSKLAFLEAPPVLLERVFKIYEKLYFQYLKELQEKVKNVRDIAYKANQKIYFSKNDLPIWEEWMKNVGDEQKYSRQFIANNILPRFLKFVKSSNKKFVFESIIPTLSQPPDAFLSSYSDNGIYYISIVINKLYDEPSGAELNNLQFNVSIKIESGFTENTFDGTSFEENLSFEQIKTMFRRGLPKFKFNYADNTDNFLKNLQNKNVDNDIKDFLPSINKQEIINSDMVAAYKDERKPEFNEYRDDKDIFGYKISNFKISKEDLSSWRWVKIIPEFFYDKDFELILTIGPSTIDDEFGSKHFGFATNDQIAVGIEKFKSKDFDGSNLNIKIKKDLREIKETLNHELSHLLQEASKHHILGLPPKVKGNKEYDDYGYNASEERTQEHQFRPIEVYPRLGDSLFRFKEAIKDVAPDEQPEFIRKFIYEDRNFKTVLNSISNEYEEKVYQNMVKQFLKQVQLLGYSI